MKIKVSEATPPQLDWLVAKCEGLDTVWWDARGRPFERCDYEVDPLYEPSTKWRQGGPIIEREKIGIVPSDDDVSMWVGSVFEPDWKFNRTGSTPLIAAMRCYVASKLGDEVDIPDELLKE